MKPIYNERQNTVILYSCQVYDNFDVTAVAFPDGFDFSEGWKKAVEESDKKARDLLESYYKKCQERNVSFKI